MRRLGALLCLVFMLVGLAKAQVLVERGDHAYMGYNKNWGRVDAPNFVRLTSGTKIWGIDISYFQTVTSWSTIAQNELFVVMRASYGQSSFDTSFASFRAAAEAQNIPIGFYHYAYPHISGNTPQNEANNFCNRVGTLKAGQFAVLDMEDTTYTGDWVAWSKAWLDAVQARLGVKPLIYINLSTNNSYDWSPVVNANYGLWLARWDGSPTAAAPATDWPFCAMRQYSATLTVPGISGSADVDGDVFYGTVSQLKSYGATAPTAVWNSPPASQWYSSNEQYAYTCAGRGTLTVKQYADGSLLATSSSGTGTIPLSTLSDDAWHEIWVQVTDGFGLTTASPHQFVGRDSLAPIVQLTAGTPGAWYRSPTTVTFQGADGQSGLKRMQYQWDSAGYGNWSATNPFGVALQQGKHHLYVQAEDNAYVGASATGNASVTDLGEFWLDTAMPTLNASARVASTKGNVVVALYLTNPNISPAEPVTVDSLDLNGVSIQDSWKVGSVAGGANTEHTFTFPTSFGAAHSLPLHCTIHIGSAVLNRTVTVTRFR